MKQITEHDELELALKQMPCPECGETGFLIPQHMRFRIFHNGRLIETAGEGWVCHGGCDAVFMSDEVTRELTLMARMIDVGVHGTYAETNSEAEAVIFHTLH